MNFLIVVYSVHGSRTSQVRMWLNVGIMDTREHWTLRAGRTCRVPIALDVAPGTGTEQPHRSGVSCTFFFPLPVVMSPRVFIIFPYFHLFVPCR